jgi:hypothetical protein
VSIDRCHYFFHFWRKAGEPAAPRIMAFDPRPAGRLVLADRCASHMKTNFSLRRLNAVRVRTHLLRWAYQGCALLAVAFGPATFAQTAPITRLVNLSVRTKLAPGETLIAGFVLSGVTPARVLVRGVGPSLKPFGITDALLNPSLSLVDGRKVVIAENDNWLAADAPVAASVGAFPLAAASSDAALVTMVSAAPYTVLLSSRTSGDSGTTMIEVYDASTDVEAATAHLINLSVRGSVADDAPLIGGFVIRGTASKRYLLRVSGPALVPFGVTGALPDPRLDLFDQAGTVIRSNDNWESGSAAETLDLKQAFLRVGAFPLPTGGRDAAVIATLAPGLYSVRASGVGTTAGAALIEIYELPD